MSPAKVGDLSRAVLDRLLAEGKRAPITVLLVTILVALAAWVVWPDVRRGDAQEATLKGLIKEFHEMKYGLRVDGLRTRIVTLDGQLFELEREQTNCEHEGRLAPDVVLEQIFKLRTERQLAMGELTALFAEQAREEGAGHPATPPPP